MFKYLSNKIISFINDYIFVKDDVPDVSCDPDDDKEEVNKILYFIILIILLEHIRFVVY